MKYIKEEKSGLLSVVKPLSPEDFDHGEIREGGYDNHISFFCNIKFNKPDDLTEEEKEIMGFSPYRASYIDDESYERSRYTSSVRVSKDVKMQGVRKDKQPEKLEREKTELKRKLKGKQLRIRTRKVINEMNEEINKKVERHNKEKIREKVGVYAKPCNWKWEEKEDSTIVEIEKQISQTHDLLSSLYSTVRKLQKEAMVDAVTKSDDIHDAIKEAFSTYVQENGIDTGHRGFLY
jgi:hypothetical protein